MNKHKEAIAHTNLLKTQNISESLNNLQKRQMPNSSGGWPGIECDAPTFQHSSSLAGDDIGDYLQTAPLTEDLSQKSQNSTLQNEQEAFNALASLDAFDNEIYVTKFSNTTTCDNIMTYMRNCDLNVDSTKVFRLTKRNQDVSMLSFVSFKIETTKEIATKLLQPKFWPRGSYAKKFVRKDTIVSNLSNFLSRNTTLHQAP